MNTYITALFICHTFRDHNLSDRDQREAKHDQRSGPGKNVGTNSLIQI